jgi:hypothetical protein
MKSKELRIGNIVFDDISNDYVYVDAIIIKIMDCDCDDKDAYQPIPLTEEWLVKFGFALENRKGEFVYSLKKNDIEIYVQYLSQNLTTINGFTLRYQSTLFFVHQLQNLYFALTSQEL